MHVIDIAFANGYSLPYPGFALLHNRRECAENLRLIGGMRVSYARSLPHASKRGTPKSESSVTVIAPGFLICRLFDASRRLY
jgi:hypothetical protein